jgi:hypothetical protein
MKLLKSSKFKLPTLYFISDRKEIQELPPGVPFIYGDIQDEQYIIRILEYEVLWLKAKESGMPFNFKKILIDNGYEDLINYGHSLTTYIDYTSSTITNGDDWDIDSSKQLNNSNIFKEYIKDSTVYVDIQKLKDLHIFPVWLDTIEKAVETNIHSFATFNFNMYNKKLDGMYGALEFTNPKRNLIIPDISSSIPKAVSTITLLMAKNMAESFYADVLVTGAISVLYPYEMLHTLNVEEVYRKIGMNNEQKYFKRLLTSEEKHYNTAIAFGDNNHPGDRWSEGDSYISDEQGKKMCKWKVDKMISFHTDGTNRLAGYLRWFDVPEKNIQRISNWMKYL